MVAGTGLKFKTGTRTAQPNLQIPKLYPSYDMRTDLCLQSICVHIPGSIDTVHRKLFIYKTQ